jgi:hypothetical protein
MIQVNTHPGKLCQRVAKRKEGIRTRDYKAAPDLELQSKGKGGTSGKHERSSCY